MNHTQPLSPAAALLEKHHDLLLDAAQVQLLRYRFNSKSNYWDISAEDLAQRAAQSLLEHSDAPLPPIDMREEVKGFFTAVCRNIFCKIIEERNAIKRGKGCHVFPLEQLEIIDERKKANERGAETREEVLAVVGAMEQEAHQKTRHPIYKHLRRILESGGDVPGSTEVAKDTGANERMVRRVYNSLRREMREKLHPAPEAQTDDGTFSTREAKGKRHSDGNTSRGA